VGRWNAFGYKSLAIALVLERGLLTLEAMRGVEEVLDDPPPQALAIGFESAGVQLRARWWIKPPRQMDVYESQDHVITGIRGTLTQGGIELYNPNA
jgi:hypothetical protein